MLRKDRREIVLKASKEPVAITGAVRMTGAAVQGERAVIFKYVLNKF